MFIEKNDPPALFLMPAPSIKPLLKVSGLISCCLLSACVATNTVQSSEQISSNGPKTATTKNETSKSEEAKESGRPQQSEKADKALSRQDKKSLEDNKNPKVAKASNKNVPSSWELSGSMAARNAKKSWTAHIHWLQSGSSSYQIRLNGPLGSGSVLVERKGGAVNFRDGKKTSTSSNADALLQAQTGVRLPVSNLYYWVRGIPAPGGVASEKRGNAGQLLSLKQAGFTVEYPEYTSAGSALLPKIIKLQGNGVFVKLAIKSWKPL